MMNHQEELTDMCAYMHIVQMYLLCHSLEMYEGTG